MPWFPDFVSAAELVRKQTRAAGHADPVGQYLRALDEGDAKSLETVWPAEVVVDDPYAGQVRGHRQLRHFMRQSKSWLDQHHARTEWVAATCVPGRAVVELLAHLEGYGPDLAWPIAVAVESSDQSVTFRTYCSQWPVTGQRRSRSALLPAAGVEPDGIVGRHEEAVRAGDVDGVVATFTADGYLREAIGPHAVHRGDAALRAYYDRCFVDGGVIHEPCAVTDDGARCVVEYNCLRWGSRDLAPQAGLAVYQRGSGALLSAVRIYDDLEPPAIRSGA